MSTRDIWPLLLGISEKEWEKRKFEFKNVFTQISNFSENLSAAIKEINSVLDHSRPVIERFVSFVSDKNAVSKIFSEHLTFVHKKLLKHGYFIGLASFSIGHSRELIKLLDHGDQVAIDDYLLGLLKDKKYIERMSNKWKSNAYFKSRHRFLLRGLTAHLEKDYIASVPILLPHIEAILAEFFIVAGLLSDTPDKFCGNRALSILKNISVDEVCTEVDRVYFRRFLHQKGVYEFKLGENSYLNRGRISHGTCLCYDQEKWSAQIIYLIDFLCCLTAVERDVSTKPDGGSLLKRKKISAK